MAVHIQFRRGSFQEWFDTNPIIPDGEPCLDTTSYQLKIGDGESRWRSLSVTGASNTLGEGFVSNAIANTLVVPINHSLTVVGDLQVTSAVIIDGTIGII